MERIWVSSVVTCSGTTDSMGLAVVGCDAGDVVEDDSNDDDDNEEDQGMQFLDQEIDICYRNDVSIHIGLLARCPRH